MTLRTWMVAAGMAASLSGCGADGMGGIRYDLGSPICLALGNALPIEAGQAERALREGIGQFGGMLTTERGCAQTLTVVYDAACTCTEPLCVATRPTTAAYVGPWQWSVIHLCPASREAVLSVGSEVAADIVLKHELGHVFGAVHQPSGLMAETPSYDHPVRSFQPSDIAAVCSQHKITSPVCR